MMFENNRNETISSEQLTSKTNSRNQFDSENTTIIPVTSLEEVAYHFRDTDENYRYEYFLMQVKEPLVAAIVPPPFTKILETKPAMENNEPVAQFNIAANAVEENTSKSNAMPSEANVTASAATSAKVEKDDLNYLAQNADLLLAAGEVELARNIYRAILKTCEANDVAYVGLAACADKEGLVEQAIQFAWDSVAFAPNRKGYQLLAQLLVQQGRDQEASQALTRALRSLELTNTEQADYQKMIGNCMARLGQNTEAERAYKKALELSPASDEVQSNLGSLYLEQGLVSEAKRCYQDSIASNPQNDKAWVGLGLCCVAEGDKESAHESFARSLEKNLRNSTAIFHLVKCAYEIKKYSTAEKMLSNYVEMAPVSPSLLYSLAGLQFHVGKKREASTTAKRILQLKGDHQGAKDLIKRIDSEAV